MIKHCYCTVDEVLKLSVFVFKNNFAGEKFYKFAFIYLSRAVSAIPRSQIHDRIQSPNKLLLVREFVAISLRLDKIVIVQGAILSKILFFFNTDYLTPHHNGLYKYADDN